MDTFGANNPAPEQRDSSSRNAVEELNSIPAFACTDSDLCASLARIAQAFEGVETQLRRIADHVDPPPPDKVGTSYVANRLGCTMIWVTEMVRNGDVPAGCIVPGTGNRKPWKFFRTRIDQWIESR